jgi:hypothetical protein
MYMLRGSAPFDQQGVSIGMVAVTYLAIGLAAGALVGLLRPITRQRLGAYAVGLVAGVPVATGLVIVVRGLPGSWDFFDPFILMIFSVVAGHLIGSELWKHAQRQGTS